jgi:membrane protease subunit HflC
MRTLFTIFLIILVLVLVRLSVYTVDASEFAYVTILGKHVTTHDGGRDGAGLHFGWPWPIQVVQRLDRRIQEFDLPATEHLTSDQEGKTVDKNLSIEGYVVWRISDDVAVDRFIKSIGTSDRARSILAPSIISHLGASLQQMKMDDLINVEPGLVDKNMQTWQSALLARLQEQVRKGYGIELVDVRLRRFNFPGETRNAIFARIRSERQKKVTEYQSEGERQAKNIESSAEEKFRTMLAEARFQEERLKGQADTEAMRIRSQAHSQDPEFYAFLKKMEKLQSILGDNRTVLLLSTHRPFFDLLFQPPRPNGPTPTPAISSSSTPPGKGD